jgi:NAD(P)-dependent dehydrogenase (short-subunit alcohol dehydrogenase family)
LVIGGSSGIGLETARQARVEGAAVILTARDPVRVHLAGLELEAAIAAFDATDFDRLEGFFDALGRGSVDHVLVTGPSCLGSPMARLAADRAHSDLEAHLLLPLHIAREAPRKMQSGGSLLFTGCASDRRTIDGPSFAAAMTAALSTMTQALALELAPIRVNLIVADRVAPVRTEGHTTPPDVAAVAVQLMMDAAVTGATVVIEDGQQTVRS